ncbi:MAG: hypothetical protein Q9168_006681 [Polycauliona sp. 1 TL-2023]
MVSQRNNKRQEDPNAVKTLDWRPTKTYIKLTRIFLTTGDLMAEKKNANLQSELDNLVNDARGFASRHVDEVIYGNRNAYDPKSHDWIYSKCNPRGNFKLSVANAHIYHRLYISAHGSFPPYITGNEITWSVLKVALQILDRFMTADPYGFTQCSFEIWDGENQVGKAQIVSVADVNECIF